MSFLDRPAPRWFNIPAHRAFLGDLAQGLYAALAPQGPEALSDAIVLLPTRRGARALAEAFVATAGGRALLLPQIRAIGDLDEGEPPFEPGDLAADLPPAISGWRRRFELARLVSDNAHLLGRTLDAAGALELTDALASFLDGVQIEEATSLDALDDWVEAELARHWKISADFLKLATRAWPARLAELGLVDVAERRVALLNALAEQWTRRPPRGVLVAAGSTGAAPATARLLKVIASAPRGCVVLPGLDQDLADTAWAQVGEQHPQGAMKRLLARAGVERGQVQPWSPPSPGDARGRWRRRIINEALRPAETTADWLAQIDSLKAEGGRDGVDPIAEGFAGLSVVAAANEEEAATVAALLLRETLETPDATAALITPDAVLARRVSAKLARWGVEADSSAGAPLAGFPVGELIALVADLAAEPVDPTGLLAVLKHPLTRLGREAETLDRERTLLERRGLRGARPRDWAQIETRLGDGPARPLLDALRAAIDIARAPGVEADVPPAIRARALVEALESLAAIIPSPLVGEGGPRSRSEWEDEGSRRPLQPAPPDPNPTGPGDPSSSHGDAMGPSFSHKGRRDEDTGALWSGPAGESASALMAALIDESAGLPESTAAQFADLLGVLLAGETVRSGGANHPRLRILGAIEARLVRADRLILAGLEEGVWPAPAPVDPFLSRPMREAAGLPPPERRLGLSAHDFAQAACAPDVVLLRSERRGNAPAVASRWLWRLQTLAKGAGATLPGRPELIDWARALDAPDQAIRPATRPKPRPPVAVRPRTLAVTGVERWVRDPYATYAREILRLKPLERPDEPVEARVRGSAIHAAFERFAIEHAGDLAEAAPDLFARLLIEELEKAGMPAPRLTRERALAANIAPWVLAFERRRRPEANLLIEQKGEHSFETAVGRFTVTAKADRIEVRGKTADVLDFKTGQAPSVRQVQTGLSPQLTLTAAILHHGGFADLGRLSPRELVYVRVSGGRKPGEEVVRARDGESLDLALHALEGLRRRVARFDDEKTPYVSWAAPQFIDQYGGDYDHLARVWEWHVIGEAEDNGAGE